MTPSAHAILESWSAPLGVNLSLCLTALVYTIGWFHLRIVFPNLIPAWRLTTFSAGIVSLWIAVGSPIEAFDDVSLSVHMVQHLLLMAVAPPLILLGVPTLPLLRGLPRTIRGVMSRFLRYAPAQWFGRVLTDPAVCWIAASVALIAWHVPAAFEPALRSDSWHKFEHACFFATSLMFWWPVIQPFPSVAKWPDWSIPLYLFLGTLPGGALGAFLTFCDRVLYPSYGSAQMVFHVSPIDDQTFAGALMWVFGTFVYMVPAVILTVRLLSGDTPPRRNKKAIHHRKLAGGGHVHSHAEVVLGGKPALNRSSGFGGWERVTPCSGRNARSHTRLLGAHETGSEFSHSRHHLGRLLLGLHTGLWRISYLAGYKYAVGHIARGQRRRHAEPIHRARLRLSSRTARRPLASGRAEPSNALWCGISLSAAGAVYLALTVNVLASLLALVTLLTYLFLYTPLKRKTPLCVLIGAFPGAVPPLIGWAAARGRLDPKAWVLYAMVFLWQFPHFMAIAWMYREDYARAGYLVLPLDERRDRFVIWQSAAVSLALIPLSLLPAITGEAGVVYSVGAFILGSIFFHYSARFAFRRSNVAARQLLAVSIIYLPLVVILLVLDKK